MNLFSHLEATHLLTKALDLCAIAPEFSTTSIKWHRQLGECYYNIGQPQKALEHLGRALRLLNEPDPTHQDNLVNSFPLLSHLEANFPSRVDKKQRNKTLGRKKTSGVQERQEFVRTLLCLAQVYGFFCRKSLLLYCTLRALNRAEQLMSAPSEFIRSLSHSVFSAGVVGRSDCAEKYIQIGECLFPDFWGRRAWQYTGMYYSSVAKWAPAKDHLERSLKEAQIVQDTRSSEECLIFLSFNNFMQGNLGESWDQVDSVIKSSHQRGDLQMHVLAYLAQAHLLYSQGKLSTFFEIMDSFDFAFAPGVGYKMDIVSHCLYHSLMCIKSYKQENYSKSFAEAMLVCELFDSKETEPTFYFAFLGLYYSLLIMVLLLHKFDWSGKMKYTYLNLTQKKYIALLTKHMKHFEEISCIFKSSVPASKIISGLFYQTQSKHPFQLQEGLEFCQTQGMKYFEAIIHFWIGFSSIKDSHQTVQAKLQHRERAMEMFVQMDVFDTMLVGW
eukprot:TRINITY_DN10966_c0_g1_i1.p1 TRINITY_DN10966_c0_g1~~TRINITY_DN10966_c0_g1_i1.p1  ORF type:complete len:499 (+),score=98.75 TRINITY_DN10966_c0_g1_i1:551-2047(+)